jgi:transcriptional regulator GlxA family with amidase domain
MNPHGLGIGLPSDSPAAASRNPGLARASAHLSDAMDSPALAHALLKLLNSAQQALAADQRRADQLIERATSLILAEVDSHRRGHSPSAGSKPCRLAPWQVQRAKQFIEANLANKVRVMDLARITRLSGSYFAKAFRADVGKSPYAYILHERIERAQEVMLTTSESLASIAVACGFADQSHFTRLFHRLVGMSPAGWRRARASPMHAQWLGR